MHLEERCRKSLENHVSFVTRSLRSDSATTATSSSSSTAVFGQQQQQQPDGAYTPDDSDMESGGDDDERTLVAAEKAEGLFRTDDDGDWRRRVDEELEDLKADAEKPLDEILTVLPKEYVDAIGSSASGSGIRSSAYSPRTSPEITRASAIATGSGHAPACASGVPGASHCAGCAGSRSSLRHLILMSRTGSPVSAIRAVTPMA